MCRHKLGVCVMRIDVLIIILLLAIMLCPVSLALAQAQRWYAGYYYRSYEGWGPYGVTGRIYTIDPYVPSYDAHFQWVTVILSYDPLYWLQLGYHRNPPHHGLLFYWEAFDSTISEHNDIQNPTPTFGEDYSHLIVSLQENEWYKFHVYETYDGQVGLIWQHEISVKPYAAVDLQAFVETTTYGINIDGTHFSGLRHYYGGRGWFLWNRHVPGVDYPYQLNEISHYEFQASGGG